MLAYYVAACLVSTHASVTLTCYCVCVLGGGWGGGGSVTALTN